jgi:hypothetical protein
LRNTARIRAQNVWTDKEGVMRMCSEFAALHSRHRSNEEKMLAGKDWVRETFARDMG